MGLDQYLRASVRAPADSSLHELIEQHLTDDHREELSEYGYAYVSGWSFGDQKPESLFTALTLEMGITPTSHSPYILIRRASDGYTVEPTIFYWRKVNAIHRWFVDNVQDGADDCERYTVYMETLVGLVDACEEVTADHSKAESLLPTQSGFFFGSTAYGEYYFEEVAETATELKAAIAASAPKSTHYVYQSSW